MLIIASDILSMVAFTLVFRVALSRFKIARAVVVISANEREKRADSDRHIIAGTAPIHFYAILAPYIIAMMARLQTH